MPRKQFTKEQLERPKSGRSGNSANSGNKLPSAIEKRLKARERKATKDDLTDEHKEKLEKIHVSYVDKVLLE